MVCALNNHAGGKQLSNDLFIRAISWTRALLRLPFLLRGASQGHLLKSDLVGNACALDERVFLLVQLGAQIINLLMLVKDLQLLKVEVSFFELQTLPIFLLHKSLSLLLDLDFVETILLSLSHLTTHLCLLLPDLPRQLNVVISALLTALHRHLLLGEVVVCDGLYRLPLRLLVLF